MKAALFLLLTLSASAAFARDTARPRTHTSVWAVDFVKTKSGHFDDYLNYIRANWAEARADARKRGDVVSYKVLTVPDNADWDVLLMTEYADMTSYDAREAHFKDVLAKIHNGKGITLIHGLGSRDLADIKFSKVLNEVQ